MTALLLALALPALSGVEGAAPLQDEEPTDPFQWARTIDELDLTWNWGEFRFAVTGMVTLEAFVFQKEAPGVHVEDPALRDGKYKRSKEADSPEFNARLQVFLDGGFREWLEYSLEVRHDATTSVGNHIGLRAEQAFLRFKLPEEPAVNGQIGKFAAPLGNFIPRHQPDKNPLTTWPLAYDHLTSLTSLADSPVTLEQTRDNRDIKDWYTPIWQGIYGVGLMGFGTWMDFTYQIAVMNSAPATLPEQWTDDAGDPDFFNLYLHVLYPVDPTTRVGVSWSRGPYEHRDAKAGPIGPGPGPGPGAAAGVGDAEDSYQTLFGVDVAFATGKLEMYAELYWTELEAPAIGDMDLWTWYIEGKYAITPRIFGAARIAQMYFGRVDDGAGGKFQWDRDVSRFELGGGYLFTTNFFVKLTTQFNFHMGGREPRDHMLMLQVCLEF